MAQSYHISSRICTKPKKPSNCGSGLGGQSLAISLGRTTTGLSETPAAAAAAAAGQAGNPGPERKKVVVIGAGISGLRAASVLQRHGVDVVVLEARDRIGGRICTSRKEGAATRDIGAAWMHETSCNKLVKLVTRLNIEFYYDDGLALYYTEQGRAGSQFKAKKVADEFADHVEWYYEKHPHAADRTVADFMRDFVGKHELITADERAWAPQAVKEVELWIGTSVEQASARHLSYFITERNLYMKGGYDSIVNWTASSLKDRPDAIRLNRFVEHISWGDDGSVVTYHDETGAVGTIEADAVVVTIPLGALHHNLIGFTPALPSDIQLGISSFSYGALGKIFFEFTDVFWSKDNDQFMYYPSPPTEEDEDAYATSWSSGSSGTGDNVLAYATVTINLWIMTGSKQLCVQIAEPLTQRIEAMTDDKDIYKFFEPLFKLFRTEPYKALPRCTNIETTKWTQDPLAGYGSYSADKVGDDPEILMSALEEHKGSRLQFAGEHCTMVANGCVHGAFATGETAAKNLLDTFDVPYDGGDLVSIN